MPNQHSPFSFPSSSSTTSESAESLFSVLTPSDPSIQQLWSHQADALRRFHEVRENPDVAVELPTGSGKTLVAILIAEWLRRSQGARVLLLCPDNALVQQVTSKAFEYGVAAVAFTGSARQYDPADRARFNSGQAIGITNYWTVFNSDPKLTPTHILLDDAHSSGPAIASMWNLDLERSEHTDAYNSLADFSKPWLGSDLLHAIATERQSRGVELIPSPVLQSHSQELTALVDEHLDSNSAATFPWSAIRNHLSACNMFVTSSRISMRPFLPPTHFASVFSNAKQRIYLSATLGADGDLERIVGRSPITYVRSSLQGSIGRRFIAFASSDFQEEDLRSILTALFQSPGRSVFLVPGEHLAASLATELKPYAKGRPILTNADIRDGYDPFLRASNAILLLANRYDGVDLPGDQCRQLHLVGLPTTVDPQESFLWQNLGAQGALVSRVLIRLSQGLGRTTRGFRDYSLVLLHGPELLDFVTTTEHLRVFNPVLAAELDFARLQLNSTPSETLRMIQSFMSQDQAWLQVEEHLASQAQMSGGPSGDSVLSSVAPLEIGFCKAMWDSDYDSACAYADLIHQRLDAQTHAGYKAWWTLQAAGAHFCSDPEDKATISTAVSRLDDARDLVSNSRPFLNMIRAIRTIANDSASIEVKDDRLELATDRVLAQLESLGAEGTRFDKKATELAQGLSASRATKFEAAIYELGLWLGVDSWRRKISAAPDTIWHLSGDHILGFEAKTDKASPTLSFDDIRQAVTHDDWIRGNDPLCHADSEVRVVMVSSCTGYDRSASEMAGRVSHAPHQDLISLGQLAIGQMQELRQKVKTIGDPIRRRRICSNLLNQSEISPWTVYEHLTAKTLDTQLSSRET